MTVLIVDDSPEFRRSLRKLLDTLVDVKIVGEAGSVWEAIQLAAENKPKAVILDIKLPGGSGFDVLREIKKNGERAPLVVVLTNYASAHYRQKSLEGGADYFFDKSTEFEEILAVLKNKSAIAI
ncbi:response regulator transcription factor [candidate division KSB1 bacterium]|nr:response regulator transcription factor [candidate division KSB1 bacterium]